VDVEGTLERLERSIAAYGAKRVFVAFSGGVDSAVVLALAARALGREAVCAVTAVSPSYPMGELEQARKVAESLGVPHRTIATREVEREAYARNDALRCYHCKTELYAALAGVASLSTSADVVVLAGANADDLADFRPGLRAAEQRGVRNPLLEEGIGKALVRAVAARLGLAVAEKPALACLSSRVAYGIRITPELLARIDRAEQAVRGLGFDQVRVRHLGDEASIEVSPGEVRRLAARPDLPDLLRSLRDLGWAKVRIDPDGYRTGSLNASLLNT
jgi:uncharacterized protein